MVAVVDMTGTHKMQMVNVATILKRLAVYAVSHQEQL